MAKVACRSHGVARTFRTFQVELQVEVSNFFKVCWSSSGASPPFQYPPVFASCAHGLRDLCTRTLARLAAAVAPATAAISPAPWRAWFPPPPGAPPWSPPPGAPPPGAPGPPPGAPPLGAPPPGAPPSTVRPPPAVIPRPPGRPFFPSALRSSWTEGTSTGYEAIKNAPQFLVIPACTGRVRVTLKQDTNAPAAAVALLGGRIGGTRYFGRWNNDDSGRWGGFCYGGGAVDFDVRQGESYTLLVATHTKGLRLGGSRSLEFTVELSNADTGAPLPLQRALTPMGSQTLDGKESVRCVAEERARRAAALASMRAVAEASPLNSPQRAHWEDFQAASAAVEAKRAGRVPPRGCSIQRRVERHEGGSW